MGAESTAIAVPSGNVNASDSQSEPAGEAKRPWEELVAVGLEVCGRHHWALGDLALEVETSYGEHELEKYADQIGVKYKSLKVYRWVARQWPPVTRVTHLSWTAHRILGAMDDRIELVKRVKTIEEVRQLASERASGDDKRHRSARQLAVTSNESDTPANLVLAVATLLAPLAAAFEGIKFTVENTGSTSPADWVIVVPAAERETAARLATLVHDLARDLGQVADVLADAAAKADRREERAAGAK
jgi:hypothetical protein